MGQITSYQRASVKKALNYSATLKNQLGTLVLTTTDEGVENIISNALNLLDILYTTFPEKTKIAEEKFANDNETKKEDTPCGFENYI
jgi:hypothetical protein